MVGVYREKTGPVTVRQRDKASGPSGMYNYAPSLQKALPESIKEMDSIQSFGASLKTHLFIQAGQSL